jgi:hypothetical protein
MACIFIIALGEMSSPIPCLRCRKLIQFFPGYVSKSGKLIPLDYPSGQPHRHVFPSQVSQPLDDKLFKELSFLKSDYMKLGSVMIKPENNSNIVFDKSKYVDKAITYEKTLILAAEKKEFPHFKLSVSDLSPQMKKELLSLSSVKLQIVLRKAVLRIYKNLDENYNEFLPRSGYLSLNFSNEIGGILKVDLV